MFHHPLYAKKCRPDPPLACPRGTIHHIIKLSRTNKICGNTWFLSVWNKCMPNTGCKKMYLTLKLYVWNSEPWMFEMLVFFFYFQDLFFSTLGGMEEKRREESLFARLRFYSSAPFLYFCNFCQIFGILNCKNYLRLSIKLQFNNRNTIYQNKVYGNVLS